MLFQSISAETVDLYYIFDNIERLIFGHFEKFSGQPRVILLMLDHC